MTKKIAVFCSGNGSNFEAILTAIRRKKLKAEVAVMICDRPGAFAITRAQHAGIPVAVLPPKLFSDRRSHEKLIVSILRDQKVSCVILAGYMRILTPYFIKAFRGRILNIHPSLLPAFKGAHAIRDAFQARVKATGVTVHGVTVKLDSGPILAQQIVPISKKDTLESLEARIHRAEHALYPKAIANYLNKGAKV